MKIIILSTSRADASALQVVYEALKSEHEMVLFSIDSAYSNVFESARAALHTYEPDLAFVHGDRWDAMLAATACVVTRTKLAHLGGGDVTRGSYDDRMRDAITMLADYHFVGSQGALYRVINDLGRDGRRCHVVGEPALDWLCKVRDDLPGYDEIASAWGLRSFDGYVLVNWQPETMAEKPNAGLALILRALAQLCATVAVFFVNPNVDYGAPVAFAMMEDFRKTFTGRRIVVLKEGVPRETYAALMKHCKIMIGNSSSGLIEAPSLGTRFIMVGDRQLGRPMAESTYPVANTDSVERLVHQITALSTLGRFHAANPYGDGRAGERIAEALRHKAGP